MAVLRDLVHELVFGHHAGKTVAEGGKDDVPEAGTDGGVEDEMREAHLGQAGGDADEVTDTRHKTSDQCADSAVVIEIDFGLTHLFFVEQTEMTEGAVGKGVDDGAPEETGGGIVDHGSQVGTERSTEHHKHHVQVATFCGSTIGGRRHHELTRNGYDRTLECHQEGDGPVVEVFDAPGDEGRHNLKIYDFTIYDLLFIGQFSL